MVHHLQGKRLLILIGGHLATAPRPQKEAAAAKGAGARVRISGVWWNDAFAREDQWLASQLGVECLPVLDIRPDSKNRFAARLKQRLARELYGRLGITTARTFGTGGPEMARAARQWKPDLVMVHSEAALWAGAQLLREGFRVGADFEDWFSEDLLPEARAQRPIAGLKKLERLFLRSGHCQFATTQAMAEALAQDAGTDRIPAAIPNAFPAQEPWKQNSPVNDERPADAVCFYWFSQTIGPGRGLETVAEALPRLTGNWRVYLRGNLGSNRAWFEQTFKAEMRGRVIVLPVVPNSELASRTRCYDVGLALEEPYCRNKDLTASNKLFEYLRCGLGVIATETSGQKEVMARCAEAGRLIAPKDSASLAKAMQECINEPAKLGQMKHASRIAGETTWAWERFIPQITNALSKAVSA